jgi:hypothetical protein
MTSDQMEFGDVGKTQAQFHAMTNGTAADWVVISEAVVEFGRELPERILAHLRHSQWRFRLICR